MDYSTTFTKKERSRRSGAVLVDLLVGSGLTALVLLVLTLLTLFGGRSFLAMANYVILDQKSRHALDRMSQEIRQCNRLIGWSTNYLMFEDYDGGNLLYYYIPSVKTLYRFKNWRQTSTPLLEGCEYLQFWTYQRNPVGGSYDQYPAATLETCKLVQLSWVCSRPILANQNTESVQSAKIVIRKQ